MFRIPFKLAAGVGLAVVLSSCGQAAPTTPGGGAGASQNNVGQPAQGKRLGGAMALFSDLPLTDDQRAQLAAIAAKYRAQWPASPLARVRELLTAEVVDADALRAALSAEPTTDPRLATLSAMLQEARAVLTDAQRSTLIQQMQAVAIPTTTPKPEPVPTEAERAAWLERVAVRLSLTADQKAAFGAFVDQQRVAGGEPQAPVDQTARRDALVRFIQTGDATALDILKPAPSPPVAVEALVALATKLDQAQRKALFGEHRSH